MNMKLSVFATLLLSAGCGFCQDHPAKKESTKPSGTEKEEKYDKKVPLKVLPPAELDQILQHRLNGGLSDKFKQFANMFFVRSGLDTGWNVGLSGADDEIARTELQPVFPQFYKPTLRELLDTIALQTFSTWSYRKEDQFLGSKANEKEDRSDIIIVHFQKTQRAKPYEVTLATDWKSEDRGHWTACIPPSAPMGMDIYETGTYSAKDKAREPELFERVRKAVALDWAQRVKPGSQADDLKRAKVGPFDALFFESMIDARTGSKVHWRHWVFMAGNECYFIVSTIFPDDEKTFYPDVEGMLKTFRIRKP
ncbi:MAG: hypothetical protein QOE70_1766 [Chthoniobacter sp.]|jgi:hypothetical protein|nr:hypothetical protein [Chthoniobacter sp.]